MGAGSGTQPEPPVSNRCSRQSAREIDEMTIRAAINGYGRIGRNTLRALYESHRHRDLRIVAVNDLGDVATNAHLTRHDSVHGRFPGEIGTEGDDLLINGDRVRVLSETRPESLPWAEMGIDVVLECTGRFTKRAQAERHLQAGAGKVLISAPAKGADATIVYGVNDQILGADDRVVSNASCTTNCLAPLAKVMHETVGIDAGVMTTIHSYTNDQVLSDGYHKDLRRARSATQSMIPTKTGAAAAVGLVLPELAGRLDGFAVRVPTVNVSFVDFSMTASRDTTVEDIHAAMQTAADGPLKGILACTNEPLVSIDFNHTEVSCTYDQSLTRVVRGRLVKVCGWYDNEWGFSNRMLDTAIAMARAG